MSTFLFFLAIFFFHINLTAGIYVLHLNPKNRTHVTFFLLQLSLALTNLGFIAFHLSKDIHTLSFCFQHFTSATTYVPMLIVVLALQLTNIIPIKKRYYVILIIYATIMGVINSLFSPFADFIYYDGSWRLAGFVSKPALFLHCFHYDILGLIFNIIIIAWYFKTPYKREKKQARALILSVSLTFFMYTIYLVWGIPLLKVINYEVAGSAHFFGIIWTLGFWFCLVRYRMLSLTPDLVSRNILSGINESVILLDNSMGIITANDKTRDLVKIDKPENIKLSSIICEYPRIEKTIAETLGGRIKDFSCRLNYRDCDGRKILMDTKFSAIRDKYQDAVGILIIGREVKELKQFKNLYKTTDKEEDIIQFIINGSTAKEIACELNITESTVKTHLTNIYNKLGVDNKIQLLNLLKDFDLLPEQKSEKNLFLINRPD